jgi:hypothetical protein
MIIEHLKFKIKLNIKILLRTLIFSYQKRYQIPVKFGFLFYKNAAIPYFAPFLLKSPPKIDP